MDENLGHKRALYAYKCIESVDITNSKYRSAVRSAGVLIQNSGLMQTLSFYLSKKKDEHYKLLATHILQWNPVETINDEPATLFGNLLKCSDDEIMYKTQETKALISWLKRFAEAKINGK